MNREGRGGITGEILTGFLLLVAFAAPFSIAISQMALAGAILLRLAGFFRTPRLPRLGLEIPLLLWLGWILLILPAATDPGASVLHLKRWWLIPALWLIAEAASKDRARKLFFYALALGMSGVAIYGILQGFGIIDIAQEFRDMRKLPLTTNPMTAGGIMMIGSLTLLAFLERRQNHWRTIFLALAFLLSLWTLLFIQSRACWLGFLGGAFVLLLLRKPRLAWAIPVILALALVFGPAEYRSRFTSAFKPGVEYRSNWQRIHMWKTAWLILKDHPLIGIGDRDLGEFYKQYTAEENRENVVTYRHMHSNPVMFAVLWGVPGLAFALVFLFMIPLLQWRRFRALKTAGDRAPPDLLAWTTAGIAVWTGFMIAGLFEWYFGDAEVILLVWIIIGLSLTPWEKLHENSHA
jgi:O-antigen ligase